MGLLSAMTIIPKIKAPDAKRFIGKHVKNSIFLKYHLLHQENSLAHLLCHVTYINVTYFNKCSDPDDKLANL